MTASLDSQLIQHMRCCAAMDVTVVRQLLEKGADPNVNDDYNAISVLGRAIEIGSADIVQLLISKGANVNAMSSSDPSKPEIFRARTLPMIELLMKHGADIRVKSTTDATLLHEHATSTADIVAFLLSKGLDVDARDRFGKTVLKLVQEEQAFLTKAQAEKRSGEVNQFEDRLANNGAIMKVLLQYGAR